jgi:hypothetical protein
MHRDDVVTTSGNFDNLAPVPINSDSGRDFMLTAGFDADNDSTLDSDEITRAVAVHLFKVKFLATYSDQFAGVNVNYLPLHAGPFKNYILMGLSNDGFAHVRTQIEATGIPASMLRFAVVPTTFNMSQFDHIPSYSLSGNVVSVDNSPLSLLTNSTDVKEWKVVYGLDTHATGTFNGDEVLGWSDQPLRIVTSAARSKARADLDAVRVAWSAAPYPHSANFMWAFLNDLGLAEAANETVQFSAVGDKGLDHFVGIAFNNAGSGPINQATFSTGSSTLPTDVAESSLIRAKITAFLQTVKASIEADFATYPVGSSRNYSWDESDQAFYNRFHGGIAFDGLDDLNFSIGSADLDGMQLQLTVNKEDDGHGGTSLYADSLQISGNLRDLYDFNFDATGLGSDLVQVAAVLQAGYRTPGMGGHVFLVKVDMSSIPLPWVYNF